MVPDEIQQSLIMFLNSVVYNARHFNVQATEKNMIAYNSYITLGNDNNSNYTSNKPEYCDFTNCIVLNASDNYIPITE